MLPLLLVHIATTTGQAVLVATGTRDTHGGDGSAEREGDDDDAAADDKLRSVFTKARHNTDTRSARVHGMKVVDDSCGDDEGEWIDDSGARAEGERTAAERGRGQQRERQRQRRRNTALTLALGLTPHLSTEHSLWSRDVRNERRWAISALPQLQRLATAHGHRPGPSRLELQPTAPAHHMCDHSPAVSAHHHRRSVALFTALL